MKSILQRSLTPLRNLTPRQIEYYKDRHRFVVLPAGRRSRKTLNSKRNVFFEAMMNANAKYFHGAPTRQQAKDIFWKDLKNYTRPFRSIPPNETELKITLFNGTEIHVIGLDRPERIEGQPWNGCHITEFGNTKPGAWGENIRPLLSDTGGFAWLDGVPEGRNHYYDLALFATDGVIPKTQPMIGQFVESKEHPEWAYFHWFSSDVLSPAEIASAKESLDERTYRQEYEGSFESYEGLAYYAFGKHNYALVERQPGKEIHIGMDFNIDPMTATLGHIIGDTYEQWGEIYLRNSNTFEMAEVLKHKFPNDKIVIFPDSTGKHLNSNATVSDIEILRKAGFEVRAKTKNPFQVDRINAVNSFIKAGEHIRYKVNPKNCPKTINDFNRVEALPDGRLDKRLEEQGLVHITDALGYLISYNWPIKQGEVYIS